MACGGCGKSKEPPKATLPPLSTRGVNLAKAVFHWGINGFQQTLPDEYDKRIEACNNCDKLVDDTKCLVCGCFVTLKAGMATEKCPLGKWGEKQEPTPDKPKCPHGSYNGHVFFDRTDPLQHSVQVTVRCKLCGEQMLFRLQESEYGVVDMLKANLVSLDDAGT